ncbi:hypothetical protein KI387_029374 [Taxus chinensis]|uniref:Pentatricopeptide repeat-containing protein n=1 Tax=Taxus chinensis TaxID=29808 RepID=A0AA38CC75_TAXCH|nr:hypothetical protein KI387_029374 [Taxus chinensis]
MPISSGKLYKPPLQLQRRSFKIHALVNEEEIGPRIAEKIDTFLLKKYEEEEYEERMVPAYNSYIKWLRLDERLKEALQLTTYMEQKGIPRTSNTYFGLIADLCSSGKLNEALELFNKTKSMPGCEPHKLIYDVVIERLCKEKQYESAVGLFVEMFQKDLTPELYTVFGLLEALCEKKRYSWATDLVHVTFPPAVEYYNCLITAFLDVDEPVLAKDVLRLMQERGVNPNYLSYRHVFIAFLGKGLYPEACEIGDEMKTNEFYKEMETKGLLEEEEAMRFLKEIKTKASVEGKDDLEGKDGDGDGDGDEDGEKGV